MREKLIELLLQADIEDEFSETTTEHRGYIADLMIANGVTVRAKGEWVLNQIYWWTCSECGYSPDEKFCYCPNCGADMRGAEHETD